MRFTRHLITFAAVAALVGGLVGSAAAHRRVIDHVYAVTWDDGMGNDLVVHTEAWLEPETHPGVMKTTLKKRNAAGDWVKIATKRATYQIGWGYMVDFPPVAGNKRCKAVAKFTSRNHPTLTKASPAFDC